MKKILILLVGLFLVTGALAHGPRDPYVRQGGGYGSGGHGFQEQPPNYYGGPHHNHHRDRGPSIGQIVAGALILGTTAVIIDRTLPPPPPQMIYCDQTPFVRGGLVYANPCDGSGSGPVVVGRIDRR